MSAGTRFPVTVFTLVVSFEALTDPALLDTARGGLCTNLERLVRASGIPDQRHDLSGFTPTGRWIIAGNLCR